MNWRTIIVIALSVAIIAPASALALTNEELYAQLAALQAELQKITLGSSAIYSASATPSRPTACLKLTRTLGRGSRGPDVLELQRFLGGEGLLTPDSITGYFGALTEAAVKQWQASHGIVSSGSPATTGYGVVGARTRAAIANCSHAGTVPSSPLNPVPNISIPQGSLGGSNASPYVPPGQFDYLYQPIAVESGSGGGSASTGSSVSTGGSASTGGNTGGVDTTSSSTVSTTQSCVLDGVTVASGDSHTFYAQSSPAYWSCADFAQSRTCTKGTLNGSPSFQYSSCAPAAATVNHVPSPTADNFCYECLQVRVGRPYIIRKAANDELDGQVPHVRLSSGKFRAFSSEFSSYAIDGNYASDVWSGSRVKVLGPGPSGSNSQCGRWLNAVIPDPSSNRLIGFVHEERMSGGCISPYNPHKSMAISFSSDEGLTWSNPYDTSGPTAQIVGGTDAIDDSKITGEGDCGAVKGQSNDIYLYCLRTSDSASITLHASLSNLSPSGWKKYYNGSFSEPGVAGKSDAIGNVGLVPAYFKQLNRVAVAQYQWLPGIGTTINLNFSSDFVHFKTNVLKSGLLVPFSEGISWTRPQSYDSSTYFGAFVNYADGTNAVDNQNFGLNYVYYPPGGDANTKYLVLQDISVSVVPSSPLAQVATELARWKYQNGRYRSTTGPMNGSEYWNWTFDTTLGYVLTGPADKPTYKLEECKSNWADEYLTTIAGSCDANWYKHYRTVGWSYQNQEAGTKPIYRCWSASLSSHFVSNQADCEGKGNMESQLGYVLAQ